MDSFNLAMLLEHRALHDPDKVCLMAGAERRTFAQVYEQAQRAAGALAALGIRPGQRVGMLMSNEPAFFSAHFGILQLGAVPVPMNVTSPGPEVAYVLGDTQAVAIIASSASMHAAAEGAQASPACQHIIVAGASGDLPAGALGYESLLAQSQPQASPAARHPDDEALVLYTAGTTGRPRGVVLTQFNLYFSALFIARDFWEVRSDDVVLMVASGAHIFGQMILSVAMVTGAALSLLPRFEPEAFLRAIQSDRVTFFAGVPTLAHLMLHSPAVKAFDLTSLRAVMFSGAPLHPQVAAQFAQTFGVRLITGYGMTEGVPMTYLTADMFAAAPSGAVGLPAFGTGIRVVDENDRDVAADALGEVLVRGPQVFREYLNLPQETAQAMRGGWFHTGDVGRLDQKGYLFIVDRLKDMIKRSGYAISPAEVERALQSHAAVAESAVVGVADDALGEEIKAFVVLRPGANATAEELIAHCQAQLAAYKYPRQIEFRDSLPKSPAGKILRRVLREQANP
jgi:long-chain acyl-CoA synthetase